MKKISILLVCVIGILFLSGCWDKQELEDNTFAVLLGIDTEGDNNVVVTVAFPQTQTQGGSISEGMDNGSGEYSIMSVKAQTVVEGFNMFSTKLSGPLALYSIKTIVISQELAESDMLRQVFSSWRYNEIRNTVNVLISECKASEFIQARIKNSPIDPLRQEELLLEEANGSADYRPIQLLELLTSLKSDSGDGVAMYGGVSAQTEDEDSDLPEIEGAVKEGYLPDEIPISAENKSQISGLAVFRGTKMVGVLDSFEAQIYSMLASNRARIVLAISDPLDEEFNIVAEILPVGKSKISSSIEDEVPVFNIDVSLNCTVESIQSQIDYTSPENYRILTEHIKEFCKENMASLIAKTQKEYNADILKLGDKLTYHFRTVKEWEEYDWPERYKDAEITLNVNLNIERTGIMLP